MELSTQLCSCCSIFSYLCNVLQIVVCSFVLFRMNYLFCLFEIIYTQFQHHVHHWLYKQCNDKIADVLCSAHVYCRINCAQCSPSIYVAIGVIVDHHFATVFSYILTLLRVHLKCSCYFLTHSFSRNTYLRQLGATLTTFVKCRLPVTFVVERW